MREEILAREVISFCKECERYHVNFEKSNLRPEYGVHLTEREKEEANSFPIYTKPLPLLPGFVMDFVLPDSMEDHLKYKKSIKQKFIWDTL